MTQDGGQTVKSCIGEIQLACNRNSPSFGRAAFGGTPFGTPFGGPSFGRANIDRTGAYWPFVLGIHRWPVNSQHKSQWRGTLMFSLIEYYSYHEFFQFNDLAMLTHCGALLCQLQWRHNGRDSVSNHQPHEIFTQSFIQTQIKENIKTPCHWLLCGEFTGDRWIPRTNGQLRGKYFHLMTSSCHSIRSTSLQAFRLTTSSL